MTSPRCRGPGPATGDPGPGTASTPATPAQVGAIHGEFRRLGFSCRDRAERLAAAAAFLGLAELASTRDLTVGEAGQLVRFLRECRSRADLEAAARLRCNPDWQVRLFTRLLKALVRQEDGGSLAS